MHPHSMEEKKMTKTMGWSATVLLSAMMLTACGPSSEQIAAEKKAVELEEQMAALQVELQAVSEERDGMSSELEALRARESTLASENEQMQALVSEATELAEGQHAAKARLGARLAHVQGQLWAAEMALNTERHLRSRAGAAFALRTIDHDQALARLSTEKHLRSRAGAAHARASMQRDATADSLRTEKTLRSRLGAAHARLSIAHNDLHQRHDTAQAMRSQLGAKYALAQIESRRLDSALRATQVQTDSLATSNEVLQTELETATDENDRRWQAFADQLKSLADNLTSPAAAEDMAESAEESSTAN